MSPKRWFVLQSVFLTLNLIGIILAQNSDDPEVVVPLFFILPVIWSVNVLVGLSRKGGWMQYVAVMLMVAVLASSYMILSAEDESINECPRPKTSSQSC